MINIELISSAVSVLMQVHQPDTIDLWYVKDQQNRYLICVHP
jgi:hypothetical protein